MSSYVSHKIIDLEYIPFRLPYSRPMKMASFTFDKGDFLLLIIKVEGGVTGYGEVQLPPILGTTIEGAAGVVDSYLRPVIVGREVFDIDIILAAMDKVIEGNTSVKCGVDLAILDAQGKICNLPICNLLGGCYREEGDVEWATGVAEPEVMAERAKKAYYEDGYRVMELKGCGNPDQDIAAIRLTKEAIPHADMQLKMDFNEGYSVAQAIKTLRKMEAFNLMLYEQPVPGWDIDGLAAVTHAVDTPVMADEAIVNESDLLRIIEKRAADIAHIKPPRAGGLIKARRMLKLAKAAGLEVTIGPYMCSGLGLAGGHQLVASMPKLFRDDHYGFSLTNADDILTTLPMEKNAKVKFKMGPGAGVEIDFAKVEKYRVDLK
jgi:L-alanine-DL-glutamate epimerase-like enolase superfamily enzyme